MVVNKKKKSPLGTLIKITAVAFFISLFVFFVVSDGSFSLFNLFDRFFNDSTGENPRTKNNPNVAVKILAANNSYDFDIDFEIENLIFDYFKLYYGAFGELSENKLNTVYTYNSGSELYDVFIHNYMTSLRQNYAVDLTYSDCDVIITYESSNTNAKNIAEVTLSVNFSAKFNGLNGISVIPFQRHNFVMKNKSGEWLIEKHDDLSGTGRYFDGILSGLIKTDGYKKSDITKTYMPKYLEQMNSVLGTVLVDFEEAELSENHEIPEFEEAYQRDKAVEYALEWTLAEREVRNLLDYTSYDDNSVNFTSQCINAGNIPMDAQGFVQWKWYSDVLNEEQQSGVKRTGYSSSWINGGQFYNYIKNNSGFGMVARVVPLKTAEIGDVVQLLNGTAVIYQCLVTDIVNGELVVTGNSDDIINVPLSALGYNSVRVIKIYGFNTTN